MGQARKQRSSREKMFIKKLTEINLQLNKLSLHEAFELYSRLECEFTIPSALDEVLKVECRRRLSEQRFLLSIDKAESIDFIDECFSNMEGLGFTDFQQEVKFKIILLHVYKRAGNSKKLNDLAKSLRRDLSEEIAILSKYKETVIDICEP
jgi:hypothetical protein